jgi:type IV secretion system protein VirB10
MQSRVSSALAIGLMLTLGVGLLGWYYSQALTRSSRVEQAARKKSEQRAQGEVPLPALGPITPPRLAVAPTPPANATPSALDTALGPPPELPPAASEPSAPLVLDAHRAQGARPHAAGSTDRALQRRLAGSVFITTSHDETGTASTPSAPGAVMDAPGPPVAEAGRSGGPALGGVGSGRAEGVAAPGTPELRTVGTLLTPTVAPASTALVLPTQHLLLPKGAFLDCTLETAIDTSLAGFTTCILPTDVFGADGHVVLLERGSKLIARGSRARSIGTSGIALARRS